LLASEVSCCSAILLHLFPYSTKSSSRTEAALRNYIRSEGSIEDAPSLSRKVQVPGNVLGSAHNSSLHDPLEQFAHHNTLCILLACTRDSIYFDLDSLSLGFHLRPQVRIYNLCVFNQGDNYTPLVPPEHNIFILEHSFVISPIHSKTQPR
jgi:hypothetical protein